MMKQPLAFIVDNDVEHAADVRRSLEMAGFTVEAVNDGWSALVRLQRVLPDVIILQPQLPIVSGPEIAYHVRLDGRLADVPILMQTHGDIITERARQLADIVLEQQVLPAAVARTALELTQTKRRPTFETPLAQSSPDAPPLTV